MGKLSSALFRAARISRDLSAATSGNPKRMAQRVKNKAVGRILARSVFKALWR